MKTILLWEHDKPRFDQNDPTEAVELQYESFIIPVLQHLFPSSFVIKYKPPVYFEGEKSKPDLAIIDKAWGHWFVVEVEIPTHSLQKHVIPQVRAFLNGDYRVEAVRALADGLGIDEIKARTIVSYVPRYVAVVSNHDEDDWGKVLAAENVQYLSICEYSRPASSTKALLVNGTLQAADMNIGFGTVLASGQVVRLPNSGFWKEGEYRIAEETGTGTWICVILEKEVWLTKKIGVIQIPDKTVVQFIKQDAQIIMRRLYV